MATIFTGARCIRMAADVSASELLTFDAPTREECTVNRVTLEYAAAGAGAAERSDLMWRRLRRSGGTARLPAGKSVEGRLDWAFSTGAESSRRISREVKMLRDLYKTNLA